MTITEFLLARIAEVEMFAESIESVSYRPRFLTTPDGRVLLSTVGIEPRDLLLAGCERDQRIVEEHGECDPDRILYPSSPPMCRTCHHDGDEPDYPCPTLRATASIYATHPDYREEWKP